MNSSTLRTFAAKTLAATLVVGLGSTGCSSGGGGGGVATDGGTTVIDDSGHVIAVDGGAVVDTAPSTGTDVNPYGVPYPTTGLGTTARKGSVAGSVFANLKFTGYPNADSSKGLQPVSMADYFDPEMRKYKIIVIAGTGNWCQYCKKEVQEVVSKYSEFTTEKVGFINAVLESSSRAPATKDDLDAWITNYKITFPTFLDPGGEQLNVYGKSFPVNFILDARSMEILAIVLGSPSEGTLTRAKVYTKWVDTHPATKF